MLTQGFLVKIRKQAIRKRVYYRALDRLERGILDLSSRLLDSAKNVVLLQQLYEIVMKLEEALKGRLQRHMESFGLRRGTEIIMQAVKFGYREAVGWLRDPGLAEYLSVMDLNSPFGVSRTNV
ncbi:hypothetical protein HN588_05260 [Candidatus Bathyarchaeota archaeon]|nr:hypothetical protein [Candidatus Bathyarchaeota archaeon]